MKANMDQSEDKENNPAVVIVQLDSDSDSESEGFIRWRDYYGEDEKSMSKVYSFFA